MLIVYGIYYYELLRNFVFFIIFKNMEMGWFIIGIFGIYYIYNFLVLFFIY